MSERIKAGVKKDNIANNLMHKMVGVPRNFCVNIVLLVTLFGITGASMAGDGFSEQGNALSKALADYLIEKKICKDYQTCHNAHQMYREDGGDRIYLNMYGQKDMRLTSIVTEFLVARGLKITGGREITLHVFSGPHEQYQGFKRIFGQSGESIKLEINK